MSAMTLTTSVIASVDPGARQNGCNELDSFVILQQLRNEESLGSRGEILRRSSSE
ncbi:hypothetical protein KKA14_11350 [bacterium]|nr:hypothetical protein [bacterium]